MSELISTVKNSSIKIWPLPFPGGTRTNLNATGIAMTAAEEAMIVIKVEVIEIVTEIAEITTETNLETD